MSTSSNDAALNINGTTISFATSTYEGLEEPNKMIDGQRTTYWATSGLYPQQFTLTFPKLISVSSIKVRCYMVRLIQIEKCDAVKPSNFIVVCEKELDPTDVEHQMQPLYEGQLSAYHIRFTILSGYDHICAIYKIEVEGSDSYSEGNVQKEFSVEEFGRISNKRETEWTTSPKKQIPFSSSMDTLQEFEEAPLHHLNNKNEDDDIDNNDGSEDNYNNNNETNAIQQINDFRPVTAARSSSELPATSMQVPHGSPSIISQRSPSTSFVGNTSEVRRPSTAQRSSTGRNSIMKKTKLEMFTESEEVSSGEEF